MLGQDEHEIETKNRNSTNSAFELTNPLDMVKKTCQALESLNSDFRDRSQLEITMLGQDEHEIDTKNRTSTNSTSELTKPLKMLKKSIQAIQSLNSDVQDRSQLEITMLGHVEHETDTKIEIQRIQLLSSRTPYKW